MLLSCMLCITACGAVGGGGPEVPEEATVVLHDPPRAPRAPGGRSFPATTIIFTTATEDLEGEPDQGLEVTVGTRPAGAPPPPKSITQIAKGTTRPATRVLDRESFAALWQTLDQAGLFRLPRRPGAPPTDENYILVKTPTERWVYTRPRPAGQTPEDLEKTRQLVQYWRASRVAIVSFLNR